MQTLSLSQNHGMTVIIGDPDKHGILDFITRLALIGPVQIIVGDNRFNAHQLARIIRQYTVQLDETLDRIHQARPFTCYQMLHLLKETQTVTPLVVLDVLNTFYDESLSDAESIRLFSQACKRLAQISQATPVLVTGRPPPAIVGQRQGLSTTLQRTADSVFLVESPVEASQPTLF